MSLLVVQGLCKKIGKKKILDNINLTLDEGDILAFIGPNGAGKTTSIKCILGLQKLTSGNVTINSYDINKDFKKAIESVGCIVESPDVYMNFSGYENLKMKAMYYQNISEERLQYLTKLVGLENRIYNKVSTYSLGMRQRLGIAISLINDPNILILDEPTNGLDPEGIKDLRELFVKLAKSGKAILISSHNLSELESFCNKACIISQGKIIEETSIDKLKIMDKNKYILKVSETKKLTKYLTKEDQIIDDNYLEVVRSEEEIGKLTENIIKAKISLYEVKKEELSLEEAFISKAGGNKID